MSRKRTIGTALAFLSLAAGAAFAQDQAQAPPPQDRQRQAPAPMMQLRKDLAAAMANAQLTDEQKQTLQNAQSSLRQAREARKQGQKPDPRTVRQALQDIRGVAQSGALRPEDRDAVVRDVHNVQARRRDAGQQRQSPQTNPAPQGAAQ